MKIQQQWATGAFEYLEEKFLVLSVKMHLTLYKALLKGLKGQLKLKIKT